MAKGSQDEVASSACSEEYFRELKYLILKGAKSTRVDKFLIIHTRSLSGTMKILYAANDLLVRENGQAKNTSDSLDDCQNSSMVKVAHHSSHCDITDNSQNEVDYDADLEHAEIISVNNSGVSMESSIHLHSPTSTNGIRRNVPRTNDPEYKTVESLSDINGSLDKENIGDPHTSTIYLPQNAMRTSGPKYEAAESLNDIDKNLDKENNEDLGLHAGTKDIPQIVIRTSSPDYEAVESHNNIAKTADSKNITPEQNADYGYSFLNEKEEWRGQTEPLKKTG